MGKPIADSCLGVLQFLRGGRFEFGCSESAYLTLNFFLSILSSSSAYASETLHLKRFSGSATSLPALVSAGVLHITVI